MRAQSSHEKAKASSQERQCKKIYLRWLNKNKKHCQWSGIMVPVTNIIALRENGTEKKQKNFSLESKQFTQSSENVCHRK